MLKIAKYLKQIRLDNEETLKDMARSLDVTPTFISAIEKGRKKMPVRIRKRIIDIYNLDPNQIERLDNANMESQDHIEIRIRSLPERRKTLAVQFAMGLAGFTDETVDYLLDYFEELTDNTTTPQ